MFSLERGLGYIRLISAEECVHKSKYVLEGSFGHFVSKRLQVTQVCIESTLTCIEMTCIETTELPAILLLNTRPSPTRPSPSSAIANMADNSWEGLTMLLEKFRC